MADNSLLQAALELDSLGFNILPAVPETKLPAIKWKRYQTERTSGMLRNWFTRPGPILCVVTGSISGIAVLDIDSVPALAFWTERLGKDVLGTAVHSRTPKAAAKGEGIGHYYFALPKVGEVVKNRSAHDQDQDLHWDLRAEAGIAIVPPSPGYEWVRSPLDVDLSLAPSELINRKTPKGSKRDDLAATSVRSTMSDLLANPDHYGRNDRATRMLGHYAHWFRTMPDVYHAHAEHVVWPLVSGTEGDHPYERTEFDKSVASIWGNEAGKTENKVSDCGPETGYLVAVGDETHVQTMRKDSDGNRIVDFEMWGDFALEAVGVLEDEHAERTYDVVVHRHRQGDERRDLLPATALADPKRLNGWLHGHGVGVMEPDAMAPKTGSRGDRLGRFLESQRPPHFRVIGHLGWHDDDFITYEGIIRADGLHEHGGIRCAAVDAPYQYGFTDPGVAVDALREVLTFHDETITAVFGAWWAATLLRPIVRKATSLFPVMAIQAPSGSGKTTGFFNYMVQLAGNVQGPTQMTEAALRDALSKHNAGLVWLDDVGNLDDGVWDVVRQAASEGTRVKKGEDRTSQAESQMLAPLLLTGEGLYLRGETALLERLVVLDPPTVRGRRDLHNPDRIQWLHMKEWEAKHPDLSRYAGTVVELVMRRATMVAELPELVGGEGSRWDQSMAVLRVGARILADVVDDLTVVTRVDDWVGNQENPGRLPNLFTRVLPELLRRYGMPHRVEPANGRTPTTPVIVKDDVVWFNPALASEALQFFNGRIDDRTQTAEAIAQQAREWGAGPEGFGSKRIKASDNVKPYMWCLDSELSAVVLRLAEGGADSPPGASSQSPGDQLTLDVPAVVTDELHDELFRIANIPPSEWDS